MEAAFVLLSNEYLYLPFDDKSFDMSWNFASLWYISELENSLKESLCLAEKIGAFAQALVRLREERVKRERGERFE